jgi:UDP-glucose 4-epimerase
VAGTKSVLDAMRAASVPRIIFSSTAATYGFRSEMPLRETSPQTPETPYGSTKLAAEWLIKEYARAYNLGYVLLRYFNASGADPDGRNGEDRRTESHLIPLTLQVALGKREKLAICGDDFETRDGTCVRDYVHTEDLAQAHQLAVEKLEPGMGRAYNLGNGKGVTVMEVLRACEAVVGRPIPHEIVGRRPGDPAILVASPESIVRDLGWSPRFSDINQIVETAWRWHKDHPHGYQGASPRRVDS